MRTKLGLTHLQFLMGNKDVAMFWGAPFTGPTVLSVLWCLGTRVAGGY